MISPLAHLAPEAKLGKNVVIDPFAVIEADVVIDDNCHIHSHAVIKSGVRIGKNCSIFPGAVLGAIPQDLKFKGENSLLVLEENVSVREYCTLNRGTEANMQTIIKANSLLMAYVHVAHDCIIGKNCILANGVNVAGHVEIGDYAIIGGLSAIHQFVKIGKHVMVSGGSMVLKDIPPYVKVARNPISYAGVNTVGLQRRGYTRENIHLLQEIYRLYFVDANNISQANKLVNETFEDSELKTEILSFVQHSTRGMIKGFKRTNAN